jgi:membrane protease YdiL (CAAX protease family)
VTDAASLRPATAPEIVGGNLLSGQPAYRPATPWKTAPALLVTAAIVAAGLAAMALVIRLPMPPAGQAASDGADIGRRLWALAAMQAVLVALTLLASRGLGGRPRDVLALRGTPTGWRAYAGALLAMALLQAVLAAVQHFLLRHDVLTDVRPLVGVVTGPHWPLAAAVLAAGAPLSEELLFRGFLLGALAQSRLGFGGAALVSSVAWTALHPGYSLMGLLDVLASGLLLCWLLWRTGSLRVAIFCHAAYNGAIVLAILLVTLPAAP